MFGVFVKHDGLEHTIYESSTGDEKQATPPIIDAVNKNLKIDTSENAEDFTLEKIAAKAGISENVLHEWIENDPEFTTALERLINAQKNDPLKTGTEEDTFVNSMMVALLLLETKDRHFKSRNL